jgi:hypothetical protein
MTDGTRDGDGKFSAGIHITEQDVRDCAAAFLPEIPALENDRTLLARSVIESGRR